MATLTLPYPATTLVPASTGPHRAFTPEPGSYEGVIAAAAAVYTLEDLAAALAGDASMLTLLTKRLEAARAHLEEATTAYMAGFPC